MANDWRMQLCFDMIKEAKSSIISRKLKRNKHLSFMHTYSFRSYNTEEKELENTNRYSKKNLLALYLVPSLSVIFSIIIVFSLSITALHFVINEP